MRPVRLTMQAFGPYTGRETVDFREAVEAGLFGIYGQTGSGKSTIFSAMTFALFGQAAKAEQEAPSLRSDSASPDLPTEVELVFDIGARRYVVRRRPEQRRPKQRGSGETRDAHEAWLFDATGMALEDITPEKPGKVIEEKKVGPVTRAVESLLGYGAEQFRQIVLLPQGRFEAFLVADTRSRLGILRDLFDVSLYRRLAARLKLDAEVAERKIRDERAVCAGRLASEGFDNIEALRSGVSDCQVACSALQHQETGLRQAHEQAQSALEEAHTVEALFVAAGQAVTGLAALQEQSPEMDALAVRVRDAGRASQLVDIEKQATDAATELVAAEEAAGHRQERLRIAETQAEDTARAHEAEENRAGEIDDLRQQIATLQRYGGNLARSVTAAATVTEAEKHLARTGADLQKSIGLIASLVDQRRKQTDMLRQARSAETARQDLRFRKAELEKAEALAGNFRKAGNDVKTAASEVEALVVAHDAAANAARAARTAHEEAERQLSGAQALHLAGHLRPGEACPVCGGTDHPAPATGNMEHGGLDAAFRDTREAAARLEAKEREIYTRLVSARSILGEREARLAALDAPPRSADDLGADINDIGKALIALGPATDIAAAEARLDMAEKQIGDEEAARERHRIAVQQAEAQATTARAALAAMLQDIPQMFHDAGKLGNALDQARLVLQQREDARRNAAGAATTAREAALTARNALQAAIDMVSDRRVRLAKARDIFMVRLEGAGLDEATYRALLPAVATMEHDSRTLEDFRRRLDIAADRVRDTGTKISGLTRPDIAPFMDAFNQADVELEKVRSERAQAHARLEQLERLAAELADTIRRLDEAEAESGPLRELAALFDSKNSQNLDLETFAIGAMFDQVLVAANHRLGPMTNHQYSLERALEGGGRGRRGLGIQVHDTYTGKSRPTATLSGGEGFIAALSLALGLADVVESASGRVRLDTIFIDEGFGSLDTGDGSGTLDQVLRALNELVSQNRAVGLVSHVQQVQEAIPNGFYVRKTLDGSLVEHRRFM